MKVRAVVIGLAMAVVAALVVRESRPRAAARPPAPRAAAARTAALSVAAPDEPPLPTRNVFRYVDERTPSMEEPLGPLVSGPEPPPLAPMEPAPAVDAGPRLVGLIRADGVLKAAISVDGTLAVVKEGDRAGSYTVLGIDVDGGVRLRDASGAVVTLTPAP